MEEHMEHMRLVLQRFKEEGLKLRLPPSEKASSAMKKCFFGLHEMGYLGYTVSVGNISVSTG
jgi:hypothetical protein